MKKFSFLVAIAAIVACVSMTSCKKNENLAAEQPEQDFYTVQLGWDGEILDVNYEPLLRSSQTDGLYGIQVYYTPDKKLDEGESITWTPYAYGLFDNADNISINLLVGYKYKFVATMVKDGKNKLQWDNISGYFAPFELSDRSIYAKQTNSFEYRTDLYLTRLCYGFSFLKSPYSTLSIPNTERFYGELENYIPGDNANKAKIHMKRTSFGAKFIAKGKLANSGTLQILMAGAPEMGIDLTANKKQISDIFTFSNIKSAWENNQYSETIPVTFNWHRADGTTLPLGTHDITYKRNATTVVHVNIENDGENSGIGFEYKDEELGEMPEDPDTETTITDGEIVDTEVDTNGSSESSNTIPNNQIWYTATEKVEPDSSAKFGANVVTNEWDSSTGNGIITFNGDIKTLDDEVFCSCEALTSITIPGSITSIREATFNGCPNLYAFYGPLASEDNRCLIYRTTTDILKAFAPQGLTSYSIPNNFTVIGADAFSGCSNLSEIIIPEQVTSIQNYAFWGCKNLEEIIIPSNVNKIGTQAFYECSNLSSVFCKAVTPPSITSSTFSSCSKDIKIYVPGESITDYKNQEYWSDYADKIVATSYN